MEAVGGDIFGSLSNVDNFRLEVYADIVSGTVVDPTGMKAHVKFGDSMSNRSRDIRLPHFVANDNDDVGPYANRAERH